jgi:hypothetical protein
MKPIREMKPEMKRNEENEMAKISKLGEKRRNENESVENEMAMKISKISVKESARAAKMKWRLSSMCQLMKSENSNRNNEMAIEVASAESENMKAES